jgi:hypothetical protein
VLGSAERKSGIIVISRSGMEILLSRHVRGGNTESSLIALLHLVRE